jgi:hypothetical protein
MAWINYSEERQGAFLQNLEHQKLRLELELWKNRAQHFESELANIPKALAEHGKWYMKDFIGVHTHVVLDPEYHKIQLAAADGNSEQAVTQPRAGE